tara:strand:+ start:9627 stop:9851 length:225 start_codon:yes stop_codon:yes gene_type:complete
MKIVNNLKNLIAGLLRFTTGLGFYGIGLFALALVFYFLFHGQFWTNIGTGLVGAFVYKNYAAIVSYFNELKDKF